MSARFEKAKHQLGDINDLRHLKKTNEDFSDFKKELEIIEARINRVYYRCIYPDLNIDELRLKLNRPDMKIGKDEVSTLLYLCRLAIRKSFPTSQLASGRFVRNLPIPSSLKDYLDCYRCDIFESFLE